ncbi:MAG: TIGR00266 family protein [Anaerolineales bacterium]|nr:TIGR00266 family protein [Anaerolineales bacterium]
MQTEILYRPAFSLTRVRLDPNEEIRVEGGAMVGMSEGVAIETKMQGGFLKSLARSVLGGESFFVNTYKAPAQGGEINLAPALPGDMFVLELQNESMLIQSGAFVASASSVEISTSWGGAKGFFGSGGLILLKATGSGSLVLGCYGAIHELNLAAGQKYTIDTGHIVAFSEKIGFQVRKVGGMKSTLLSGEGLVVDLTGPGRVLMQTRSTDAFLSWLIPLLPKSSNN